MQKSFFNKNIRIVAILMLMSTPAITQGQSDSLVRVYQSPCQSEWTKYNNISEINSIVRSNSYNHVVYVCEESPSPRKRHTFFVRNNSMTPVTAFSTYFVDPCNADLCPWVEISDMRLFESTCYFCGKCVSPLYNIKS